MQLIFHQCDLISIDSCQCVIKLEVFPVLWGTETHICQKEGSMTKEMTVHVPVEMIIFTFSLVLFVLLFDLNTKTSRLG